MEMSLDGEHYRLMKDGEVIYDDSTCEYLYNCESAEAVFSSYANEYIKEYEKQIGRYNVHIIEDSEYYHIDFRTGMGEAHYPKNDWTLADALANEIDE